MPFAPVVFVAVDWCEIRNEALARWQQVLAEVAGTVPERVMVSTVHQHDAPVADLAAEQILREHHAQGTVCDLAFHEIAVQRVGKALRDSLSSARRVTHLGLGLHVSTANGDFHQSSVLPQIAVIFFPMAQCALTG